MNIKAFNEDCVDLIGSQTFKNLTQGKKVCIVTDPPFIDELDSYSRIKNWNLSSIVIPKRLR